jgi:hypothetical protein
MAGYFVANYTITNEACRAEVCDKGGGQGLVRVA